MDKFRGKYRIASGRWAAWDYGSNAAYFVTICTQGRAHDFGRIAGVEMILSPLGQAVRDCWLQILDHFPFVRLGAFVVMPNHVHGIIVIDKPATVGPFGGHDPVGSRDPVETRDPVGPADKPACSWYLRRDAIFCVSAQRRKMLRLYRPHQRT